MEAATPHGRERESPVPHVRDELETLNELDAYLADGRSLEGCVFQGLDLTAYTGSLARVRLKDVVFLGCRLEPALLAHAQEQQVLIFPTLPEVPYSMYRGLLYSFEELLGSYVPGRPDSYAATLDGRIYEHYRATRAAGPDVRETLARRLHDHAITDALEELLEGRKVVAIMGGHSLLRTAPAYLTVARIAHELTRRGFLVAGGGGPGAMEAANLGAYLASRPAAAMKEAVALLTPAPHYKPRHAWLDAAFAVRKRFPPLPEDNRRHPSLGIPTWHYGHEPPNAFATHVAKYFANSVREEGLLAIASHGVIFAPGSAGTIQEVFQDAAQNHYESFGGPSPMIFLGQHYWTEVKPVFPLLRTLSEGRTYSRWLSISDDPAEVLAQIETYDRTTNR